MHNTLNYKMGYKSVVMFVMMSNFTNSYKKPIMSITRIMGILLEIK